MLTKSCMALPPSSAWLIISKDSASYFYYLLNCQSIQETLSDCPIKNISHFLAPFPYYPPVLDYWGEVPRCVGFDTQWGQCFIQFSCCSEVNLSEVSRVLLTSDKMMTVFIMETFNGHRARQCLRSLAYENLNIGKWQRVKRAGELVRNSRLPWLIDSSM